jgi:hypothetical protein
MKRTLLSIVIACLLPISSIAQNANSYCFSSDTRTYTPLTGATNVVGLTANQDDGFSAVFPLDSTSPFNFTFGGIVYNQAQISSNGILSFKNSTISEPYYSGNAATARSDRKPFLAPLWDDLKNNSIPKYVVEGTAPNRIFKIEWSGQAWDYATSNSVISFQIWLYETSNIIEYNYKRELSGINGIPNASIGIYDAADTFLMLNNSGSNPTASSTIFTTNINAKPASNQVYRFAYVLGNNNLSLSNGNSGQINATPVEGASAVLTAPTGTYFTTVNFASYGTPTGTFPNFFINTNCHSTLSQSKVETYILGNNSATIPATNTVFGDPCNGIYKKLFVLASYVEPICSGGSVNITGSTPNGGDGSYTYLWESSTTNATSGFAAAAGTNNGVNYSSSAITQTTWYRRKISSCTLTNTSSVIVVKVNPVISNNNINSDQSICTGTAPSTLIGTTPTGGNGSYTYVWESSTTSATSGFSAATGTNTNLNYVPGALTVDTWYRRRIISGSCNSTSSALAVIMSPNNSFTAASSSPNVCVGTAITAINHSTTGATGIGTAVGLPTGVTASWSSNKITISGTPTVSGTFNYSIPLTGGCGVVNAVGTITVNPLATISLIKTDETCSANNDGKITASLSGGLTNIRYIKLTQKFVNSDAWQQVAEIEAFELFTGVNVARSSTGTTATSSSNYSSSYLPTMAIDGNNSGNNNFWHSGTPNINEWIKLDLNAGKNIDFIKIYNRTDCCQFRGQNMLLELFDSSNNVVYSKTIDLYQSGANVPVNLNVLDASWSDGGTTLSRTNLDSGMYTLNINDVRGCAASKAITIGSLNTSPLSPAKGVVTNPTCSLQSSIVLNNLTIGATLLQTGTTTASYPITSTSMTISGLAPGSYNFVVSNGTCTSTVLTNVVISPAVIPTATWNGLTWSTPPTLDKKIIFDAAYNSALDLSLLPSGLLSGCSCEVNAGKNVVINSMNTLKIQNQLTVIGTGNLTFENNASLVQINDTAVIPNSGTITYKRQTTIIDKFDYTYWSSPVKNQLLINVSPNTLGDKFYSFNANGNNWNNEDAYSSIMIPAKGYIIRGPQNFYAPNPPTGIHEASFNGEPNNGGISIPVGNAGTYNLIGNPYPSAIDAELFLIQNSSVLNGTLYFWTHNTHIGLGVSNPGSGQFAYSSDDYASFNLTGGVGAKAVSAGTILNAINTNTPSGKIGAGQSFFASSKAAGTAVFNNSMRVSGGLLGINNSQFFKTKSNLNKETFIEKNRVWLNLTNTEGAFKQTLIGYITGATNDFDTAYDGRSFNANAFVNFYSLQENLKLAIQGRALPFDDSDRIPLGYKTTIAGEFKIAIEQTDGFLSNKKIFLEDKLMDKVQDLTESPYIFTTEIGAFDDRFVLSYTNKTLSTDDYEVVENGVIISTKQKEIKIKAFANTIAKIFVYDASGRQIYLNSKIDNSEFIINNLVSSDQVMIIKVVLDNKKLFTQKIIF